MSHPESTRLPSWRERVGGRWAISWQATVLGGALMLIVVTLAGTSIGSRPVQPHELGDWFLSALVGVGVICGYTALAHLTLFRHRATRPLPVPVVVAYHLGLGAVFGVSVSLTGYALGIIARPFSATTTGGFAVGALVWCLTVTLLLDSRERFRREADDLFDDVALREAQRPDEIAITTSLSSLLARSDQPAPDRHIRADAGLDVVSLDDWWQMSATLQSGQAEDPDALAALLRDAAKQGHPTPTLTAMVRQRLVRQPFGIAALFVVVAIAYFPDGTSRLGSWGLLAALGLAGSVAGVLALANLIVTRRPIGLGFGVGVAVSEVLAVAYLHGYDVVWLLGATLAVGPGRGAPEIPVPVTESLASLIFLAAVIAVTSGRRALSDMRADHLQALTAITEEQARADRTTLQQLALLAARARSGASDEQQGALVAAVDLLTAAADESDAGRRGGLLRETVEVLQPPRRGDALGDRVTAVIEPWQIMSEISLVAGEDINQIPPAVHDRVVQVVGEAVANACRHGHAQTIDIDLHLLAEPDRLIVTVTDDGSGPPSETISGLGTTLFDEASLGDFCLSSREDGSGSCLSVAIPLT